jgi:hypothetical protein
MLFGQGKDKELLRCPPFNSYNAEPDQLEHLQTNDIRRIEFGINSDGADVINLARLRLFDSTGNRITEL